MLVNFFMLYFAILHKLMFHLWKWFFLDFIQCSGLASCLLNDLLSFELDAEAAVWRFSVKYLLLILICNFPAWKSFILQLFGDHFYSKNAWKLRFLVFLLFHARKHMISSFYLKGTEFTRYCEFCSNYESLGTQTKLVQIHDLLWIRSNWGKMMISYDVF